MGIYQNNTKRIAKNTLMLYIRMLFSMLISLYTSRVVLNVLGVEDYGIYNVVGGLVVMFSIISGSLSAAVSRFLTFELGKNDAERLSKVFSTSLFIHICLAVIILISIEIIGVWFLNYQMVIPEDRLFAANCVLQFSMLTFIIQLIGVSYNASIISHEKMKTFAYIGMADVTFKLLIVLSLDFLPSGCDNLIAYSFLLFCLSVLFQAIYWTYCIRNFAECRFSLHFEKTIFKEITGFAGWNFIGASSALLRDQGGNILLNLFGGPAVNAARGIANSVNGAVAAFAGNFMVAVNPQITKSYASGERDYMIQLIFKSSRFSFYLLLILSLPILINTHYILHLWLGQVPEHSVCFVQLVLIFSMLESVSTPLITAMLATGKIKKYQIIVGGLQLLNIPISYMFLKINFFPEIIVVVAIFVSFICLCARVYLLKDMIGLSAKSICREVFLNLLKVVSSALLIPLIFLLLKNDTFIYFITSSLICVATCLLSVLFIGCSKSERHFIMDKVKVLLDKIKLC